MVAMDQPDQRAARGWSSLKALLDGARTDRTNRTDLSLARMRAGAQARAYIRARTHGITLVTLVWLVFLKENNNLNVDQPKWLGWSGWSA